MNKEFSLLIAGDFFVTKEFITEDLISNEIVKVFNDADIRVINFEAPIIPDLRESIPILKTGPNLFMKQDVAFHVLNKLNIDLVTLANNHIMDFGFDGLQNTIDELDCNGIDYVGAGISLEDAQKPYVVKNDDITITILNFAENEWANAGIDKSGANPIDIISNINQIRKAKETSDFVIIIIHGGHEYFHYPSPRMVKQYRFYADNGADAIVGHHTHCVGGYEIHNNVPIFYSLGNLLFTIQSLYSQWYTGLVLKLNIRKNEKVKFQLFPVQQNRQQFNLCLCSDIEKQVVFNQLAVINNAIINDEVLLKKWHEFTSSLSKQTLTIFNPIHGIKNRYIRTALIRTGINKWFSNEVNHLQILNRVRCESHRDALIEILKQNIFRIL